MFLGIDQSLRSTGVALIDASGALSYQGTINPVKLKGVERLAYIRRGLEEALNSVGAKQVTYAAIEGYSYGSVGTLFELGEVGAVVRLVLHDNRVPFVIAAPTQLKRFVSGDGQATKDRMRAAVADTWGITIVQDDECDAFGLAQLARSYALDTGTTRAQLEVVRKLRSEKTKAPLSKIPCTLIADI